MTSRRSMAVTLVLLACRTTPTDDKPSDQIDKAQLTKEQKRVEKGEVVGFALQAPKLSVDAQQITINGYRVGPRSDLDSANELKRINSVFDWTKGLREHWKIVHPAQSFIPSADVTIPDDVAFADGASLLTTIAFAGYANAITVHCGDVTATINIAVPGPSRSDSDWEAPPQIEELWSSGGAWSARLKTTETEQSLEETGLFAVLDDSKSPDDAGVALDECAPPHPITLANVVATSTTDCGRAGDLFVVGGPDKFHDALAMASAALSPTDKPAKHPTITFRTKPTCEPPKDSGTSVGRGTRKPGRSVALADPTVDGGLPLQIVERTVRQSFAKFRLCYDTALKRNPTLAGTVKVKFTIEGTGAVTNAADAGSDLPDPTLVQCVVKAMGALSFPEPESGIVTVVVPIRFYPQ